MLVTGKARPSGRKVLYANRFHVDCTMFMLSYPFFSIGIATLHFAFGLVSAIWSAGDHVAQGGRVIVVILPIFIAVFGVSCSAASAKSRLRKPAIQLSRLLGTVCFFLTCQCYFEGSIIN
ncbi:hypothetical protein E1B28_006559 [Marasmius oreades]|uniref:Uncharacterized protein n=1 Tax=Marasmius oreades TaxID=181124 RepID=A0A9P7UVE6_9AGAR|nr:uncharacterized protein E1B28_006559 [Marasmius oreades]KAG7095867.1 hypothetical protein E1B28_006559 [Marasmius oreades]